MTSLPKGWEWKKLGLVATLQRGFDLPVQDRSPGSIPVFAANGPVGTHDVAKVRGPGVVTGRSGTLGQVHYVENDFWPLNTALWVKDFHGNEPRWVARLLRWMRLESHTRGTGVPTLNRNLVHAVDVPRPPRSEQRRIADILDKADAIRRKRQEAIRLTDEFLRSAFLDMFGDPVTNPKGWDTKPMGSIASFVGGGTPSRAEPSYFEGSICWATSKDMKGETLWDTQEHITNAAIERSATKLVNAGALLVVVKSKVLMHTLPVLLTMVPTCFGQDLKAIVPRRGVPARYLARHMRVGARALLRLARGVNTEGLTLDHLRDYTVMAPDKGLMDEWARREVAVEKAAEDARRGQQAAEQLFNSLAQRAFRGEL